MKITAALVERANDPFELSDVELGDPGPGEVLIRVKACGICHTDLGASAGHYPIQFPVILGHEGAGVVEQVGVGVSKVQPGDHVVMSFGSCGSCHNCQGGFPSYCANGLQANLSGMRPDGSSAYSREGQSVSGHFFSQSAFATHSLATERNVVKVDRDVPLEVVAPLGCGIQTGAGAVINTLSARPGMQIGIIGTGSVGLSAVMAARLAGCSTIVAVDIQPSRLDMALELGATHVINSAEEPELAARMQQISGGGLDAILDTTSTKSVVSEVIKGLHMRGTLLIGGAAKPGATLEFDTGDIHYGRTVAGVLEGDSIPDIFIPELINHYRQGRFPLDRLISRYPFAEINRAVEDTLNGNAIKPVLLFD